MLDDKVIASQVMQIWLSPVTIFATRTRTFVYGAAWGVTDTTELRNSQPDHLFCGG